MQAGNWPAGSEVGEILFSAEDIPGKNIFGVIKQVIARSGMTAAAFGFRHALRPTSAGRGDLRVAGDPVRGAARRHRRRRDEKAGVRRRAREPWSPAAAPV